MVRARATLVLAAAFVLAGAAFDSPSMYVPGVALALLRGRCAPLGRRGVATRPAGASVGALDDPEDEAYPLELVIRQGRVAAARRAGHAPAGRRPGARHRDGPRRECGFGCARRGGDAGTSEPATLQLTDPLRLHTVELRGESAGSVLVLPRIEPVIVRGGSGGGRGDGLLDGLEGLGAAGIDTRPIDFELDGLRPYREGSPASRIHWPTVARSREMLEHRLVAGANASPLVVLDSSRPADLEALDRAVRAAASLCVHLAPSAAARSCSPASARAEIDRQLSAWPRAHARLARVEPGGAAPRARAPRGAGASSGSPRPTEPRAVCSRPARRLSGHARPVPGRSRRSRWPDVMGGASAAARGRERRPAA